MALTASARASAQERSATAETISFDSVVSPLGRPGSPSIATATVSASTVPQALDQQMASDRGFDVSLGATYLNGDFGTDSDTSIWTSALAARFTTGNLRLSASLPWMRIQSNATVFTGIDSTPVIVSPGTGVRRTRDGLGDLTLGASYTAIPGDRTEIEFSGRVKLNTATASSGLSSGETDYSAGAQVTQTIGRFAPFVSATYRILGDSAQLRLRDGIAASAGSSVLIGNRSVVLVSYHFAQAATRLIRDSHEVFAGGSTRLGDSRLRLSVFATKGLSNGAADVAAGAGISLGL